MVTEKENEVSIANLDQGVFIEDEGDITSIWVRVKTNSILAEIPKDEAIELFTKALKLLQDEKDI